MAPSPSSNPAQGSPAPVRPAAARRSTGRPCQPTRERLSRLDGSRAATARLQWRNALVSQNLGLVHMVANRESQRTGRPYDDLCSAGYEGLIRAVESFDTSRNVALSSFAVPYIQGAMRMDQRERQQPLRTPRRLRELQQRARGLQEQRRATGLSPLPPAALAAALGCSLRRLQEADAAYEAFLTSNRIADFVAEKAALSQLQSQIEQQKYLTETQLQDRSGRLGALQAQMGQIAPEVGLFRDVNTAASDKLIALRLQREDLLGRYRPDAQPVRDLDAQIARLEEGMAAGRTTGDGASRIGVNPVYQTLQTERIQLQAEVAALRQSLDALNRQMGQLLDRRLKLAELEPRFQALSLDRDVLQANVRDFAVREEQSRAAMEIASASNDNIRIVQRATAPSRGSSLKKPVLVLAFLFAGFTALCAGLLRMFLRPGLPTPASASRTLDLPVLGVAPLKVS